MNRSLDLAISTPVMAVAAPVVATAALAVGVLDGAPVLFCQERVGHGRRPFRIWKLRTMRGGRVTPVGHVLRATGIDELPQLINVILGDMSLVGPRPLTPADVTRLGWDHPRFDRRWSTRPGLTGLAQLQMSARCHARITWVWDRAYVERPSTGRDLALLAGTAMCGVVGKRGARWLAQRIGGWWR